MGTTLDQCTQSQRTPVEPAYKTHQTSDLATVIIQIPTLSPQNENPKILL